MREIRGDWRDLFHTFRIALDLRKLSLAFVGSVLSLVGIALVLTVAMAAAHSRNGTPGLGKDLREGRWGVARERVQSFAGTLFQAPAPEQAEAAGCARCCPALSKAWNACPLSRLCRPTKAGCLALCLCGAWMMIVWSFFGGAITRIAAVELARDERIPFGEATRFARSRYFSYLGSPLSVIAAALAFALCIVGAAWVCDATWGWGVGKVLLILGFPPALLGGFLILLLAIGGIFGSCLMFPAVSAEGTDAFDAVSRAFSYVFSRPWRYVWYHLVALAYALPSFLFILCFTYGFIRITLKLGRLGMPKAGEPGGFGAVAAALPPALGGSLAMPSFSQGPLLWLAACLVSALVYLLLGLAWSYIVSFVWSVRTVIYFLMRKAVDGTEMKEVYEEESEEDLVAGGAGPSAPAGETPKTA